MLLGYADRRRIIADEHKPAIATRNLMVPATFSVDGFLAGTWRVERTSKKASLLLKPFARLGKPARTALADEGTALVQFVEPEANSTDVVIQGT